MKNESLSRGDEPPNIPRGIVRLYHRTTSANARLILRDGFVELAERYTSDFDVRGVWFSDQSAADVDHASGEPVMSIDLALSRRDLAAFEWTGDETPPYLEWLIPARIVNERMRRSEICAR